MCPSFCQFLCMKLPSGETSLLINPSCWNMIQCFNTVKRLGKCLSTLVSCYPTAAVALAEAGSYCSRIILAPDIKVSSVKLFPFHSGLTPLLDPCNSAAFHPGIAPLCCVNAYHDGVGALKDSSPCWFMRPVVSAKLLHSRGVVRF